MRKKVFKFFFPIPTIVITALILVIFSGMCYAETPDNIVYALATALGMTLVFYVMFMIPLDVIIYIVWRLINKKAKNRPKTQHINPVPVQKQGIKCPYCGLIQDPDNTFCLSCGKQINLMPTPEIDHAKNEFDRVEAYNNQFDYMTGEDFEKFCADLLSKAGFTNVSLTPKNGDHGVDITANLAGISYAIQCKCYSSNVGNSAIQQVHAGKSIYKKDIALVITNRYFTQQAIDEAELLGVKLWDRTTLNAFVQDLFKQDETKELQQLSTSELLERIKENVDKVGNEVKDILCQALHVDLKYLSGELTNSIFVLIYEAKTKEQAEYIESVSSELATKFLEYGESFSASRPFDNRIIIHIYNSSNQNKNTKECK